MCIIAHNTCAAILTVLQSDYIKLPENDELCNVLEGFKEKWRMPLAAGAIDGYYIPV